MRILVVDDQQLFRDALINLIDAQPDMMVVGEAASVRQAVARAIELQPDLVLMDYGLPDGTGVDAAVAIRARAPGVVIVFLTVHEDDQYLLKALHSGARGYLPKSLPAAELLGHLRGLRAGEAALSPAQINQVLDEFARGGSAPAARRSSELTEREAEVLREMASFATNKEIADRLVVSENTVKNHVRSILSKLGVQNRREAARLAGRDKS